MRLSPTFARAPASVLLQIILEPAVANRAIKIVIASEDFYRSSELPLEGEYAPRVSAVQYYGLPVGSYEVRVSTLASDGRELALVTRPLWVN